MQYLDISQEAVKKQRLVEGMLHFTHAAGPCRPLQKEHQGLAPAEGKGEPNVTNEIRECLLGSYASQT